MKGKILVIGMMVMLFLSVVSARDFVVYNSSNSAQPYFVVNGSLGYVGIGTGSPLNKLNVIGDANVTGNLYVNGELVGGSGSFVPYTGATADLDLGAHSFIVNTNQLYVNSTSGKVGIGTATPGSKLTLGSGVLELPGGSAAAPSLTFTGTTGTGLYTGGNNYLFITTGGINRVLFNGGSMYGYGAYSIKGSTSLTLASDGGDITLTPSVNTIFGSGNVGIGRSEERRVGKECRSRWSPYH